MSFTRLAAAAALACACLSVAHAHSIHIARYRVVDLGAASSDTSAGLGINARGAVVGELGAHAALFRGAGRVTDLGTLGGDTSEALAINRADQVVGSASVPVAGAHAFLWRQGAMTDLGTLDGGRGYSAATAINEAGQVVGWSYVDADADTHAFLYDNGRMTDIGKLPGAALGMARGINAAGHVVGVSVDDSGCAGGAFLYRDGGMTDIGLPGPDSYTAANAINDRDQIVGAAASSPTCGSDPGTTAFIHDATGLHLLGVARAGIDNVSVAKAINNHGVIVGWSTRDWEPGVAFVSDGGTPVDLNTLVDASGAGWVLNRASGIDDKGAITGVGTIAGVQHAFLAVPRYIGRD